jgi:hypothetical protein
MTLVTCHTPGCGNAEIAIDLILNHTNPETGMTEWVDGVACGVCGNDITDVADSVNPQQTSGSVTSFSSASSASPDGG